MVGVLSRMIGKGVDGGILKGFDVGEEKISLSHLSHLSHLQFEDDKIFFCSRKEKSFNYLL